MGTTAVIIGGTFNPITIAHLEMGHRVKDILPEADIFYVPSNLTFISKWKDLDQEDSIFSDQNRITLLKNVFARQNDFQLLDIEYSGRTDGTTIETVRYIKSLGYTDIYICIGMDKLQEIHKWREYKDLIKMVKIILFTRNRQYDINKFPFTDMTTKINLPERFQDISSTKVRNAIYNHDIESIRTIVPDEVYTFYKTFLQSKGDVAYV